MNKAKQQMKQKEQQKLGRNTIIFDPPTNVPISPKIIHHKGFFDVVQSFFMLQGEAFQVV